MTLDTTRRLFLDLPPANACKSAGTRVRLPQHEPPFPSGDWTGTARTRAGCRNIKSAGPSLTGLLSARCAAESDVLERPSAGTSLPRSDQLVLSGRPLVRVALVVIHDHGRPVALDQQLQLHPGIGREYEDHAGRLSWVGTNSPVTASLRRDIQRRSFACVGAQARLGEGTVGAQGEHRAIAAAPRPDHHRPR